jgi:hypothetical protein
MDGRGEDRNGVLGARAERRVDALIAQGEEGGCVDLSGVSDLIGELGLGQEEAQSVHERIERRGIEIAFIAMCAAIPC